MNKLFYKVKRLREGTKGRYIRSVAFCVPFLFFVGCTVGPNYTKPTAPVPETYKENRDWKVAEPKDHITKGRWWEVFDDSRLNGLEEQISGSNQNVAVAEAQFRQARALVRVARSAYFPTVATAPGYTRSLASSTLTSGSTGGRGSGSTASSSSVATSPVSLYDLPVDVSWELDLWGRIRRSVESSRAGVEASAGDLENVRLSAEAELAQDYFLLRVLDAQKQLLDETVQALEKSLGLTQNRYAAGVASKADVLQADTLLKITKAQAIDVQVARAQLEHAIAVLIGKAASSFSLSFTPLFTVSPPVIPVGVPSELLERRPDIAAAERRMASANAQIGVALAAYYPRVSLGASAGYMSMDLAKWLTWPSRFWSIGPAVAETLFEGGLRKGQTVQARAAYDAAVASYRQIVLMGFEEVEDGLASLRILEEEATAQDEAVKAAGQLLATTMNQYKAGITNYLNVIVVQTAFLNNQRTALDILSRRMTATVLLVKSLGGGWGLSEVVER